VRERLQQDDCVRRGWLLDGFPRTHAQAQALVEQGVVADCFIFLDVPDEILIERVVGRRTDPVTGKIYHLTFSPPPAGDSDVLARLVHRSDDTEEKVKVRLEQFHRNVEAVRDSYTDVSVSINGNQSKDVVSQQIFEAIASKLIASAAAA
jgi:adenylate kinase